MSAEVITSILTPIAVVILAYLTYLTNRQAKANHIKTEEVLAIATVIDTAVNGKAPGEQSMSQDVIDMGKDVAIIKDKQEVDNPTPALVVGENGASLRLQMQYLTKLVENMAGHLTIGEVDGR